MWHVQWGMGIMMGFSKCNLKKRSLGNFKAGRRIILE